nr:vitelline membrane protein Vm26Aa [Bactrocera oleae]
MHTSWVFANPSKRNITYSKKKNYRVPEQLKGSQYLAFFGYIRPIASRLLLSVHCGSFTVQVITSTQPTQLKTFTMKSFVCIALFAAIFSVALASPTGSAASGVQEAEAEQNIQGAYDLSRFRKAAYGGGAASILAPPCPKNYLFSCQPNLAPVACAAPAAAPSYGSAGSYSAPIPTYVAPIPAGYAGVGYNPNQYYHY